MTTTPKTLTAYALFTTDGLDGTEYRRVTARKELKDLKDMGHEDAKCLTITSTNVDDITDMLNDLSRDAGRAVTAGMIKKALKAFPEATIKVGI